MPATGALSIAVDAMGGDDGIETAVSGAVTALEHDGTLNLVLVGDHTTLERKCDTIGAGVRSRISIVGAESVLPMDVDTSGALRHGRGSSMYACLERVASGQSDAAVSAGNTGALMALSRQLLGMLPGIERPALMAAIPAAEHSVWVLDLGANIGVDAQRLLEFARLGNIAVEVLTGKKPRTGLLNIGSEPSKGPDVVREASRLIGAEPNIDFAGFVEADEVFAGGIDLVVCDGFAGNVLLKSAEGVVRLALGTAREEFGRGLLRRVIDRRMRRLHDRLDPARHNGAPLLGIRGTVIKSHGGACRQGFAAAITLAALEARGNLTPELERRLWASY